MHPVDAQQPMRWQSRKELPERGADSQRVAHAALRASVAGDQVFVVPRSAPAADHPAPLPEAVEESCTFAAGARSSGSCGKSSALHHQDSKST